MATAPNQPSSAGRAARPRRSLRARLIGAFVGVVLIALLAFGLASALVAGNALTAVVGSQLDARADEKAAILAQHLDQQVTALEILALNQTVIAAIKITNLQYPASRESIRRRLADLDAEWLAAPDTALLVDSRVGQAMPLPQTLRAYRELTPNNVELIVADAFGGLAAASDRTSDFDQSDELWWQVARAGTTFVSQPQYDESAGVSAITIAVPVFEPGNTAVLGVLRTTYRLDALVAQLEAARFGETGEAILLLPGDLRLGGERRLSAVDAEARALLDRAAAEPFVIGTLDGRSRVVSVGSLRGAPEISSLGWQLAFSQDDYEAMAPLLAARNAQLIAALAALVGAAILAYLFAGRISAPLSRLSAAAQGIAAGDLGRRVGLTGDDEIGRLAQSFDRMSAALEERVRSEQAAQVEQLRLQDAVIRVQRETLNALATPLIPLNDEVLLLPLVGSIDNERAEQVFQVLLHGVARHHARRTIVDLTGIPSLDPEVARTLVEAAQGVRLLGAEVVLTGISASLALTLTDLDLPLDQIQVAATLGEAVAERLVNGGGDAAPTRSAPPRC